MFSRVLYPRMENSLTVTCGYLTFVGTRLDSITFAIDLRVLV
jgi:hypothetical protein